MTRRRATESRAIRLITLNAAMGVGFGALLAALLVLANFAGLATLLGASADPGAALALLVGGFAATFSAVMAATAIMLIPDEDAPSPPNLRPIPAPTPAMVRARAVAPRLRR